MAAPRVNYTRNVQILAAGFFGVFCAFNTAQALETTVLDDKNLGYFTLASIYGAFTLTTIVAPKIVERLGPRLSIILGAVPYVLLVFANTAPRYYILLPASAAVGVGAGVLWTGQGIMLSRCAIREAAQTGEPVDAVTGRMNGVFWTAFQFNGAVGTAIASVILQSVSGDAFHTAVTYMFLGFGALGCVGVLMLLFLKSVPALEGGSTARASDDEGAGLVLNADSEGGDGAGAKEGSKVTLYETLRLAATSRSMQLLLPLIFYCGASLGFSGSTYPLIYQDGDPAKGGAMKLLPKSIVGYQAATFYLVNSAACFAWGKLQPRFGRRVLFASSALAMSGYLALALALATGVVAPAHGTPAAYAVVFAGAVLFGVGDSVLESQLPAIVQSPTFFPRERDRDAANSNMRMWQSLGYVAQYGMGIGLTPTMQVLVLAPLYALALAALWACDTFVRPIEGGRKGRGSGAGGREDDDDEGGSDGLKGARTPLTASDGEA